MKRLIVAILLIFDLSARGAGFDDNVLGNYEIPGQPQFGISSRDICDPGVGAIALHANPYQLRALSWDYVGAKYGFGRGGILGSFKSYRLEELYHNYEVSLRGGFRATEDFSTMLIVGLENEIFGKSDAYRNANIGAGAAYVNEIISAAAIINKLSLKKPYKSDKFRHPEALLTGSIKINKGMDFSVAYKRYPARGERWIFGQNIEITGGLYLRLGYMNNPNLLLWGLDLRWKKITFVFTYQAVGRLDDTIILGMSYKE